MSNKQDSIWKRLSTVDVLSGTLYLAVMYTVSNCPVHWHFMFRPVSSVLYCAVRCTVMSCTLYLTVLCTVPYCPIHWNFMFWPISSVLYCAVRCTVLSCTLYLLSCTLYRTVLNTGISCSDLSRSVLSCTVLYCTL